jgi:hypothetical protein
VMAFGVRNIQAAQKYTIMCRVDPKSRKFAIKTSIHR